MRSVSSYRYRVDMSPQANANDSRQRTPPTSPVSPAKDIKTAFREARSASTGRIRSPERRPLQRTLSKNLPGSKVLPAGKTAIAPGQVFVVLICCHPFHCMPLLFAVNKHLYLCNDKHAPSCSLPQVLVSETSSYRFLLMWMMQQELTAQHSFLSPLPRRYVASDRIFAHVCCHRI